MTKSIRKHFIIIRPQKFVCERWKKVITSVTLFLPIQPNPHDLYQLQFVPNLVTLAQLVVRVPGRHEVVGSNPSLCVTSLADNIPVHSGRLAFIL